MKLYIEVNLIHEATHRWEEADTIPEVSYLKNPHRHLFHIRCRKEVNHANRDIEFIQFKHQIQDHLNLIWGKDWQTHSCENVAIDLLSRFDCVEVAVFEDGEVGAVVMK